MTSGSDSKTLDSLQPAVVRFRLATAEHEQFFAWLWIEFESLGLEGVHEGTLLSEEAFERGLETESYTIDSGLAPKNRDWIGGSERLMPELYFKDIEQAKEAARRLVGAEGVTEIEIELVQPRDWNEEWRKSFQGFSLAPHFWIVPSYMEKSVHAGEVGFDPKRVIRINPGAGFGTGTHETTQLCLMELSETFSGLKDKTASVLDFGSGSGILSIGAAVFGAQALGVEIDELANDNARENVTLNRELIEAHGGSATFQETLPAPTRLFDIVVANILRNILEVFAKELVSRLKPGGRLILSGLVEDDVSRITATFSPLTGDSNPLIRARGDWRMVAFTKR